MIERQEEWGLDDAQPATTDDTLDAMVAQYSVRGPNDPYDLDVVDLVAEVRRLREELEHSRNLECDAWAALDALRHAIGNIIGITELADRSGMR